MSNKKLDFTALDDGLPGKEARWKSRDPNPVIQMSIRMHEQQYDKFRKLCKIERYTNGEMLGILMEEYLAKRAKEAK